MKIKLYGKKNIIYNMFNFFKILNKHKWSSGRIVACHAIDPGSIPGLCTENFFLKVYNIIMITRFK